MNRKKSRPILFVTAFFPLIFGCSQRKVPSTLPESSPASLSAEEAPPILVTHALDEDPPLPSEHPQGWNGLRLAEKAKTSEHGNEGHADHQVPSSAEKPATAPEEHDHAAHTGHLEHQAPSQKDRADSYSCPMHPEVISEKPGRCPRCGMNLEKKR